MGPVEFSDIQKTSVVITWKPSENDGGSPITGYYIEMREAPKSSWQRVTTVSPDITSYCVQNVKEKKDYFFKIYAENTVGRSDALVSDGVTIKSEFGKKFCNWLLIYFILSMVIVMKFCTLYSILLCPEISHILFHTFLPKLFCLCPCFPKYIMEWQTVYRLLLQDNVSYFRK